MLAPKVPSVRRIPPVVVDAALFAVALLLYGLTLMPSVLPADSGEFQLVAWRLGIAHPPGYPLYTLVGHLFSRAFASPAYALNLLSALLAAATLVLVSRAARRATGSALGGLLAALILGTSTTFWAQATTANIRMPTAVFTAWCVYALIAYQQAVRSADSSRTRAADRHLVSFALAFSLGLGHHLSLAFPGIFFIVFLLWVDPSLARRPRRWIKPGLVFLAGFLVLLYLPIRSATGGTLADGEAMTDVARPGGFFDYVLARGFEGDFFYFVNTRPDLLEDRIGLLPTLFRFQFSLAALLLAAVGAWRCARRNRPLLVLLVGGIAVQAFIALSYRAPQTVEYLLPAYVLLAVLIGFGIGDILAAPAAASADSGAHGLKSAVRIGIIALALWAGLSRGLDNLRSYQWLAGHDDTRALAESLLADAPPRAILLSNWHWANPLWYLQQVEGRRPDVDVAYVYPRGEPLAASWLSAIRASLDAGRPVIVDMFFRDEFAASPYVFEPIGREAFLVRQAPARGLPGGFVPLEADLGGKFTLLGYQLLDGRTTPAEPLALSLAWRVVEPPDRDYSFFVHLVDSAGRVVGQSDRVEATARYRPGDVIVERFTVAPLPGIAPGDYSLLTGAYSIDAGQIVPLAEGVPIAPVTVEPSSPLIDLPTQAIAISGGIYFLGATTSPSQTDSLHAGDPLVVELHFLATRPLLRDDVVSVQMVGDGYSWKVTSDSVPALGAIPTLKWVAGSEIVDRHVLRIPADARPGPAAVSLLLYDHFTQQPLALLDEQLVQQGQSIPLGTWTISP